jgi:hypothetical protein
MWRFGPDSVAAKAVSSGMALDIMLADNLSDFDSLRRKASVEVDQ